MYLQKEVIIAFQQLKLAAASEGVSLRIISGTRNFWEQKAIWERKWNANLPQFGASATCIAFQESNKEAAQQVVALFEGLGTAPVIDEKLMDAATVLAASGTAFALRYIRASMQAGIEIGFDWQTALAISAQTVKGAAEMLLEEKTHPEQLIDRVTTPQGCTIAGLNEMEMHGFSSSLIRGIKTSLKQIKG